MFKIFGQRRDWNYNIKVFELPASCSLLSTRSSRGTTSRARGLTRLSRLGSILLASSKTRRWGTNPTVGAGSDSHNVWVDSAWNTILHLGVQLWESVTIVNTGFLNISDSCLFNNVPDKESLNCLILGAAFPAVGTPNGVHMTTVVLVPATVSTLESLHK